MIEFTYELGWRAIPAWRPGSGPSDHVEQRRFAPADSGGGYGTLADAKHAAMDAHSVDCRGAWVRPGMRDPYVSALHVVQDGRMQPRALRDGVDLEEVIGRATEVAHR